MNDEEFCRIYTAYYGENIEQVCQIAQEVLSGEELKEMIEFFIKQSKSKIQHIQFDTGTSGMKSHEEFISSCNEYDIEIINSFITYHQYSHSHIPNYIHYTIKLK